MLKYSEELRQRCIDYFQTKNLKINHETADLHLASFASLWNTISDLN